MSPVCAPLGGLSHTRGPSDDALVDTTVFGLLADTAARHGRREAAVFCAQGLRRTWAQLLAEVETAAAGLAALGVGPGDRVGIWSPNRSEWLVTLFATARIGAILVGINPAYRLHELAYALNRSGVSVLVSAGDLKASHCVHLLQNLGAGASDETGPGRRLPQLRQVVRLGNEAADGLGVWADLMARGHGRVKHLPPRNAFGCHEAVSIQFTSGTTGTPKGVTLTHHHIVNNAIAVARRLRLGHDDALAIPVPLYHGFGMVVSVLACVSAGARMVFPGEGFEPGATLAAVQSERCTALHGVPTMFIAALDHPDFARFDLRTLRTGILAGAPCPVEVMRRVQRDMHMTELTIAYGMTETSPVSFQSATDDPADRCGTTVGRILPHLEVKVVDAEGRTVPVGQTGELCLRGYGVMRGYWDDPERTAEALRDGWMHTGDLAMLDGQGRCSIVGRVQDLVVRGGEPVHPREVEDCLFHHPQVAAVQVFGVPDSRQGEELCAWIITQPSQACSEDEVRAFCRGRIAPHKVPRYIRFVQDLPVTVTGKPQKFRMRDAMMKELGLQVEATA